MSPTGVIDLSREMLRLLGASRLFFYFVACVHVNWGLCLLCSDTPMQVAGMRDLAALLPYRFLLAAVFIGAGLSAAYAAWREHGTSRGLLLTGAQQFLLIVSAVSALRSVVAAALRGSDAGGVYFVLADQFHFLCMAGAHALGMWDVYFSKSVACSRGHAPEVSP